MGGIVRSAALEEVAFFVLLLLNACTVQHASDEEMIARFRANRAEFLELRNMAQEDASLGITRIERTDLDYNWERDPPEYHSSDLSLIPQARRDAYGEILDELGIDLVVTYSGGVEFVATRKGLAVSGSSKSFVWTPTPPSPIVSRLDQPLVRGGFVTDTWFDAYRVIEEHWYLNYSAN